MRTQGFKTLVSSEVHMKMGAETCSVIKIRLVVVKRGEAFYNKLLILLFNLIKNEI